MEEPNGDTLGRRVRAFWGTVAAILSFGVVLYMGRQMLAPKDEDVADAGAAAFRTQKLRLTQSEQDKEFNTVEVKDGFARVSPTAAIPFAAKTLSEQKATKSAVGVPGMAPAPGATPPGQHDPNLSIFEGKK